MQADDDPQVVIDAYGARTASAVNGIARIRRQTLDDIPRRSARRFPSRVAIIDGATRLTFAEFDAAVDRAAAALADQGMAKGDRMALLSHNCWQYPVLAFAAARIGVVLVPVNFMLGPDEVAYILDHSGAIALVAEAALAPVTTEAVRRSHGAVRIRAEIQLDSAAAHDGWADVESWLTHQGSPPDVEIGDDDPMRIMYTSGTESRPKGALLGSRSLMWQYMSCIAAGEMSEHDIEIHSMPLYHCAQLDNFLIADLYLGATSVILRRPDPVLILRAIERERATNLFCPPTVWIELLGNPELAKRDVSTLSKGYYGASAMPTSVLRDIRERFPNLRLWNFYGQTEMASLATALQPHEQDEFAGSAGRPVPNVDTRIVDLDGNEVADGTVGEIVHRSPQLILGYYRDPERTAEAFRGGWFHSGDLGRFDDEGHLYVVDRLKDVIKSGGENVSGREVEEILYEHSAVSEVAVFGVKDPRWIEAVAAAVVLRAGYRVTAQDLIAHCRTRLAGFKAPKYVVLTDSLPKNPSGKILKRELRATYADIATSAIQPLKGTSNT
jgi:fatty-acyl-CoA synthase